jgi:hypothetical protein
MIAILVIPRRFKAAPGFLECGVGLGRAAARSAKCLRQVGDPGRLANLEAFVDRPRVTAGFGYQCRDAYVAELHRLPVSMESAALQDFSAIVLRVSPWVRRIVVRRGSAGAAARSTSIRNLS